MTLREGFQKVTTWLKSLTEEKPEPQAVLPEAVAEVGKHKPSNKEDNRKSLEAQYRMIEAFLLKKGLGTRGAIMEAYFSEFSQGIGVPGIGGKREMLLLDLLFTASQEEWETRFPNIPSHPLADMEDSLLTESEIRAITTYTLLDVLDYAEVGASIGMSPIGQLRSEIVGWAKLLHMKREQIKGVPLPEAALKQVKSLEPAYLYLIQNDPNLYNVLQRYEFVRSSVEREPEYGYTPEETIQEHTMGT